MKNILVTGGVGFIGSHIVNRLVKKGHKVTILDCFNYASDIRRIDNLTDVEVLEYNLTNNDWKDKLNKFDLVINAAAETHVDHSFIRPIDFINTNIIGLHNLASYCYETDTPLLHLSTDEIIGTGDPIYEDSFNKPCNPYAFTKSAGEKLLHAYGKCYGLNWKAVRLNNTYGLKQFPDKLIPLFIDKINKGEKLTLHGDGSVLRCFMHVDDFVDAVELIIEKGSNKEIYNVATNEEHSVASVTKMICDAMGIPFEDNTINVEDRPFNDPKYDTNNDKILDLGWKPIRNLKDELPNIIEWYSGDNNFFKNKK
jgi:dTDP-glucose 4,6-dehydratase